MKKERRKPRAAPDAPAKGLSRTAPGPGTPFGARVQALLLLIKSPRAQGRSFSEKQILYPYASIKLSSMAVKRPCSSLHFNRSEVLEITREPKAHATG